MSMYPYNPFLKQAIQSAIPGVTMLRAQLARLALPGASADAASTTGVHAAVTDNGARQEVKTGLSNPPSPRQITATSGGTTSNIGSQQVTVKGTDFLGNAITEILPNFTPGQGTTVSGKLYFAKVSEVDIPAIGTGVTVAIGYGSAFGVAAESTTAIHAAVTDAGYHALVHAAVTDNGGPQTITTGITNPPAPANVTATAGGTSADIKAIQVVVTGTDTTGAPQTETLPAFTENTPGTVCGVKIFASVTQVVIPAHDDTGATTSISYGAGTGLDYIRHVSTGHTPPAVPRNVTATAGGTSGAIAAVRVHVYGSDAAGKPIDELLPAFTAATPGTVAGNKAFAFITDVGIPAQETGATVSIGFGSKLGLPYALERNQVLAAFLGGAREAVAPTVTIDPANLSGNTVTLASALDGSQVDAWVIVP